ncbi:MAG TPA: hypothetical protein VLV82_00075 [Candidatus Angelobacter sp.]|nr:hypothetical protein [Candidatus Angelobacter sp.]
MSRTTRRRTIRAVAPVAGLLAAGLLVWQGSYAAFSATTTNQADAWTTGSLVLANNGGVGTVYSGSTAALFSLSNLRPGDSGARCITVDSGGSLAGTLKLYTGTVTNTNVANPSSNLSSKLGLVVTAATLATGDTVDATCVAGSGTVAFPGVATAVYSGTLSGLGTSYAASAGAGMSVAGGAGHRVAYRISWSVDPTVDNTYQSASTTADLVWELQ